MHLYFISLSFKDLHPHERGGVRRHPNDTYGGLHEYTVPMAQERTMTRFGLEARNLARLNPILGLNRVSQGLTGWHKVIYLDENSIIELTCDAGKNIVPHGLDADVMFALTTAYELQGRPENHVVTLTIPELCSLAGVSSGGPSYQRIQKSLQRLNGVRYSAKNCWAITVGSKIKWESLDFIIIDYVRASDESQDIKSSGQFTSNTKLNIRLGAVIADSINNGFTRKINLNFYARIDQPLGRLLYRTLEERKSDQDLILPLRVWGEYLGLCEAEGKISNNEIVSIKPLSNKRIRRSLESAHNNLIELGYLLKVDYLERGDYCNIIYTFNNVNKESKPVDLRVVGLLTSRGISVSRANELFESYETEHIEQAAQCFDKRLAEGFRPRVRGAVMTDILMNPEKYQQGEPLQSLPVKVRPQEVVEGAAEPVQPPRSRQQVGTMFLGVLEQTAGDRELRERLIVQYLDPRKSLMELLELGRLSDAAARTKAAELLAR